MTWLHVAFAALGLLVAWAELSGAGPRFRRRLEEATYQRIIRHHKWDDQ